jgi:hypothetical protein
MYQVRLSYKNWYCGIQNVAVALSATVVVVPFVGLVVALVGGKDVEVKVELEPADVPLLVDD